MWFDSKGPVGTEDGGNLSQAKAGFIARPGKIVIYNTALDVLRQHEP